MFSEDLRRQIESDRNRLGRCIAGRIKFLDSDGLKALNMAGDQHFEDSTYWNESMKSCKTRETKELTKCVDQQKDRDPVLQGIWAKTMECESLSWLPF